MKNKLLTKFSSSTFVKIEVYYCYQFSIINSCGFHFFAWDQKWRFLGDILCSCGFEGHEVKKIQVNKVYMNQNSWCDVSFKRYSRLEIITSAEADTNRL